MELRRNHLPLLINVMPTLVQYGEPKNQLEPVLVVTHIVPDSVAQRSRVLAPGMRIKAVNGSRVKTLEELRKAILKSSQSSFLRIRTYEGIVAVFPLTQILRDEPRLAQIYRYPVSDTIKKLIVMEQYETQKKIRSLSPIPISQVKS